MTGKELSAIREQLNLTVEELAGELGIEPWELGKWEASDIAFESHTTLLELAMNQVHYEHTRMPDDEFAALQERIERALNPAEPDGR
jgi:transcriptional regulator with XRE-family HTH domain